MVVQPVVARPRVGLVTERRLPDLTDDDRPLVAALDALGVDARAVIWDDPTIDWAEFEVVVLRSTWDYFYPGQPDRFATWIGTIESSTQVWNPPAVLRWNLHKSYLRDLADRGVPVVPTLHLARGTTGVVAAIEDAGWSEVVAKPAISGGAYETFRFTLGDEAGEREADRLVATTDTLIQPFLARIARDGETSVIAIDRAITHAVRKRPASGEFRTQLEHGAVFEAVAPTDAERRVAEAAIAAVDGPLLYARVDLIPGNDGEPLLGELEIVEPSLYFEFSADALDRFARAIVERARV